MPNDTPTLLANASAAVLEALAHHAHDAYEAEAVRQGWVTNPASRVPWDRVPEPNRACTRAVVRAIAGDMLELRRLAFVRGAVATGQWSQSEAWEAAWLAYPVGLEAALASTRHTQGEG